MAHDRAVCAKGGTMSDSSFSERHGFTGDEPEITIREAAPDPVRDAVLMLGYAGGLGPGALRDIICEVLLKRPDPGNWSPGNIEREVSSLIDEAPWYKVYDVAERLYEAVAEDAYSPERSHVYERRLNATFRELGVGWQMTGGRLVARGSPAFTLASAEAVEVMTARGAPTAAAEIREALADLSRRPSADITGAVQHAMAALECVAREVTGRTETLGPLVRRLALPAPLDAALEKLWGFASEQGRHLREGRTPRFEEAELVVTVASAVSVYLLKRKPAGED